MLDDEQLLSEFLNQNAKLLQFIDRSFYIQLVGKITRLCPEVDAPTANQHAFVAAELLQINSKATQHYLLSEEPPLVCKLVEFYHRPCDHELLAVYVSRVMASLLGQYENAHSAIFAAVMGTGGIFHLLGEKMQNAALFVESLLLGKTRWAGGIRERNRMLGQLLQAHNFGIFDKFFDNWISIDHWREVILVMTSAESVRDY